MNRFARSGSPDKLSTATATPDKISNYDELLLLWVNWKLLQFIGCVVSVVYCIASTIELECPD